jgi:hypothetical protein
MVKLANAVSLNLMPEKSISIKKSKKKKKIKRKIYNSL